MDGITIFIQQIVYEKYHNQSQEVKDALFADFVDQAEDFVNDALVDNLPESVSDEFEELLEKGTDEEIAVFLQRNIPNIDIVVRDALIKFKDNL